MCTRRRFADVAIKRAPPLRHKYGARKFALDDTETFLSLSLMIADKFLWDFIRRRTRSLQSEPMGAQEQSLGRPSGATSSTSTSRSSLGDGQIRLFYLERSFISELKGRLEVFDLKKAPKFKALSYVCGYPYRLVERRNGVLNMLPDDASHQEADITIMCGHYPINVISNLCTALAHLASRGVRGWIWIDAICIRQDDLEERASQIK